MQCNIFPTFRNDHFWWTKLILIKTISAISLSLMFLSYILKVVPYHKSMKIFSRVIFQMIYCLAFHTQIYSSTQITSVCGIRQGSVYISFSYEYPCNSAPLIVNTILVTPQERWQSKRILSLPPPMDTPRQQIHILQVTLKTTRRLARQIFHQLWRGGHIKKSRRNEDTVGNNTPPPD